MPIIAIIPVALAVGTMMTVGVTVFTVAAAVGATLAMVGTLTKVKELQIAGTVLGLVGGIGSLASSAGVFGTAAAEAASAGAGVGTAAENITPIALDTFGSSADIFNAAEAAGIQGSLAGFEGAGGYMPSASADIVNMVNGVGQENVNITATTAAADATAADATAPAATTQTPAQQALPEATTQQLRAEAPAQPPLEEPLKEAPRSLVDSQTPTDRLASMTETQPQTDEFGNPMEMGGGDPAGGSNVRNPAAPVEPDRLAAAKETTVAADAKPTTAVETKPTAAVETKPTAAVEAKPTTATAKAETSVLKGSDTDPTGIKPPAEEKNIFDRIVAWTDKHSNLTIGAIMAASSFAKGAFGGESGKEAQTAELAAKYNAEAENNLATARLRDAEAAKLERQRENMAAGPWPVGRLSPDRPAIPAGLIQYAGGVSDAVTGKPNVGGVTGRVA